MKAKWKWVHHVNQVLLRVHPFVWLLILLLLARGSWAAPVEEKQVWLVVVYVPIIGDPIPYVRFHRVEKKLCNTQAKQIYNNVKAGKARAFCM